ncbi:CocE/NonD family hydrolase, partial [bacterium]|nr:CocE/NonD family hydrolase [bacterium]
MGRFLLATVVALSVISCTKKQKEFVYVNDFSKTESLEKELLDLQKKNQDLEKTILVQGLTQEPARAGYEDGFLRNFCQFLKPDVTIDEIASYVAPAQNSKEAYIDPLVSIAKEVSGCQFSQKLSYDYPFDYAEYQVDGGFLYLLARYNAELKVNSFYPFFYKEQLFLSVEKIQTRDGKNLTSYVIYPKNFSKPMGTVLMRSPYMNSGRYIFYAKMSLAQNNAIVIQANRGTHSSEGEFLWLDPVNGNDAEDTIQWITKQPFSNGKVVSYGISYDGYNALATAMNHPKGLEGVIACSAPANAATDSFTSAQLVERYILPYVTFSLSAPTVFDYKWFTDVMNVKAPVAERADFDLKLMGKKFNEWSYINQAIDDRESSYWSERSLYSFLEKTDIPILHMAGLKEDQDGRDTLLAYQHIEQNNPNKERHFLVLHSEGHGCGPTMGLPIYQKFVKLAEDSTTQDLMSEPHVLQSDINSVSNGYLQANQLSAVALTSKTLTVENDFFVADSEFLPLQAVSPVTTLNMFEFPVTEEMKINGAITARLKTFTKTPEVAASILFLMQTADGQYEYIGWRTAFITRKINQYEEHRLTFPLYQKAIPKGSKLILMVTTDDSNVFRRFPKSRENFVVPDGDYAGV